MRRLRRAYWGLRYRFLRRTEYAAIRSDGKYWAGPYRWQGRTFTAHRPLVYRFGTKRGCQACIDSHGLTGQAKPIRWKRN